MQFHYSRIKLYNCIQPMYIYIIINYFQIKICHAYYIVSVKITGLSLQSTFFITYL